MHSYDYFTLFISTCLLSLMYHIGIDDSDMNNPEINSGWKMFFREAILVPPNRFRPASKVGDATAEHPQVIL